MGPPKIELMMETEKSLQMTIPVLCELGGSIALTKNSNRALLKRGNWPAEENLGY